MNTGAVCKPSPVPIETSNVNMAADTFGVSSSSRVHVTGSHLFHTNFLLVFQDVSPRKTMGTFPTKMDYLKGKSQGCKNFETHPIGSIFYGCMVYHYLVMLCSRFVQNASLVAPRTSLRSPYFCLGANGSSKAARHTRSWSNWFFFRALGSLPLKIYIAMENHNSMQIPSKWLMFSSWLYIAILVCLKHMLSRI